MKTTNDLVAYSDFGVFEIADPSLLAHVSAAGALIATGTVNVQCTHGGNDPCLNVSCPEGGGNGVCLPTQTPIGNVPCPPMNDFCPPVER